MQPIAKKILRATGWLLLAVLAVELALQLTALVVRENAWRAKTQWLTGNVRVLALGDSNTYGLYLPAQDAWPAQLEARWNAQHPELPIEMINLGYPGTNSFRLLANLPQILDTFKPDVVLLMIGFNDFWTPAEMPVDRGHITWRSLLHQSRLYHLLYMMTRPQRPQDSIDSGERMLGGPATQPREMLNTVRYGNQVFSLGTLTGSPAGNSKQMPENIKAMLVLLDQHKVKHFLINYPTSHGYYPAANKKIAGVVAETHTPFIDVSDVFEEPCRSKPDTCPELLFFDAHATKAGNARVMEKILSALEPALLPPP